MIEDAIETTELCRHCLMCRHQTPMGQITSRETYTPHGFAQLIASERRGLIEWNRENAEVIFASSDNGNSRAHCVTDQPLPEAIAEARARLVEQEVAPDEAYENPFVEEAPDPVGEQGETALFVGDEAQHRAPGTLESVLALLESFDVDPVLIGKGRNNGFLASSLGLPSIATSLAKSNLQEVDRSGANRVLVLSPGDLFAFRQMYEERLGIEWPGDVELREVTTFLNERIGGNSDRSEELDGERTGPVAYVDPNHSVRVPERFDSPRNLLDRMFPELQRIELFWRKERSFPCGNLALEFTHPELAEKLTTSRLNDAAENGANRVVTDAPGTLHQLKQYEEEFDLEVSGLYGLLADAVRSC